MISQTSQGGLNPQARRQRHDFAENNFSVISIQQKDKDQVDGGHRHQRRNPEDAAALAANLPVQKRRGCAQLPQIVEDIALGLYFQLRRKAMESASSGFTYIRVLSVSSSCQSWIPCSSAMIAVTRL